MSNDFAHSSHTSSVDRPLELPALAALLQQRLSGRPPRGYLRGKTKMRDALQDALKISAARAEALVDQLKAQGFVRYGANPSAVETGRESWLIHVNPNAA